MAAWGLFEKRDVNALSRVVSARTLDGYKIRAKLALSYPRPVLPSEAEEVMMKYARAFASAVECELSNGNLPWDDMELLERIAEKVQDLPKNRVRIIGLHVWQKGAMSSGSLKAVEGNPTVPQMPAAQIRSSTPASNPQVTARPGPNRSLTPAFGYRSSTPAGGVNAPTPAGGVNAAEAPASVTTPPVSRAPMTARGPGAGSVSQTAVTAPPPRAPGASSASGNVAAAAAPRAPASPVTSGSMSAVTTPPAAAPKAHMSSANMPASGVQVTARPPMESMPRTSSDAHTAVTAPPSSRMVSGVVPAVETRIVRSKSGFMIALEQCAESKGTLVGAALAAPVRDSAAAVLFAALEAANTWLTDPLSLLDGRVDAETQHGLVGEACVCVSYLLYEALARTSIPQMLAIEVVQAACVQALMGKPMPVSEISRYLATESPREEFTARVCALLGIRETPDMQKKVEAAIRALRQEVRLCADKVQARLLMTG